MKTWIKRSLIGLLGAGIVLGGLGACSYRHERQGMAMDGAHAAKMQERIVQKVTKELSLTDAQRQRLVVVAERLRAQRQALVGSTADPRAQLQALVAGAQFDRSRAQAIVDEKTAAVRLAGPDLIAAIGDFYDSLSPAQQQQVREHLQERRRWFRHG